MSAAPPKSRISAWLERRRAARDDHRRLAAAAEAAWARYADLGARMEAAEAVGKSTSGLQSQRMPAYEAALQADAEAGRPSDHRVLFRFGLRLGDLGLLAVLDWRRSASAGSAYKADGLDVYRGLQKPAELFKFVLRLARLEMRLFLDWYGRGVGKSSKNGGAGSLGGGDGHGQLGDRAADEPGQSGDGAPGFAGLVPEQRHTTRQIFGLDIGRRRHGALRSGESAPESRLAP